MPQGLPFTSLPAFGEVGGPAFQRTDAQGNILEQAGVMIRDPETGMAEPFHGAIGKSTSTAQSASPGTPTANPVELADWQGEQALGQLSAFDKQLEAVKVPVQHALDTSYKQYQVDIETIRNSGMEQDQQRQRLGQLNANYKKKWITIQSKVEPQVQAITQQKAAARQQIVLQQALRMKEIQTYAKMAEDGLINADAAKSLQYKTLGYEVPVTAFRPPKSQSPYQVVQRNRQVMSSLDSMLGQYKVKPAKDHPWSRWDRPSELLILKPRAEWAGSKPTDKDYRTATPDEAAQYDWATSTQDRVRAESRAATDQLVGRRVADVSGTASSMVRDINMARPRGGDRKLTDTEVDGMLAEAGGDPKRAEAIARARGYDF